VRHLRKLLRRKLLRRAGVVKSFKCIWSLAMAVGIVSQAAQVGELLFTVFPLPEYLVMPRQSGLIINEKNGNFFFCLFCTKLGSLLRVNMNSEGMDLLV
jgi:membrane protein DedA with SNARE-associated domain